MTKNRDVFLCHASEEKSTVLEPLVAALKENAITYWYDEAEIKWGDSIPQKVNEGLSVSRYVIVVLSKAFISKNWPQREFNSVLNQEATTGEVRILPLIYGSEGESHEIMEAYPLLSDKLFLPWNANTDRVIKALKERLHITTSKSTLTESQGVRPVRSIPMPKNQRKFTQLERDRFLRQAYGELKEYFIEAIRILNASAQEVVAELYDVHQLKFFCSIYLNGNLLTRCKIWIGAPFSAECIVYSEGPHLDINSDHSYNDWLTVVQGENELMLEISNMGFGFNTDKGDRCLTTEKAAEYLWIKATDVLNRR